MMEVSTVLSKIYAGKARKVLAMVWENIRRVGAEDPRRVIHSLKVGIALTLVSFLYLLEPLFQGVGQNAMWAVITVVVVLEFTAGATLCKGLNRGFGTLSAGSLAFLIEFVAQKSGKVFRGTFIGISVFVIGFAATYVRFIPYIKKNYDYGVLIFILTFNLITVSSYRIDDVLHIARERLYTIAIGCALCLFMSLFVLPNWSGEDLHNSIVSKLEGLARSIEASVNEYFQDSENRSKELLCKEPIFKNYRAVLDSKSTEETLALFASWEPMHSIHCYKCPWQQYVKLGTVIRHLGYAAISLHGCLDGEIQAPWSVRRLFRDPCIRVAGEVTKILSELAKSIKNHRHCSPNMLSDHLHEALQDLNSAIKSQPRLFLGSRHSRSINNAPTHRKLDNNSQSAVALPTAKTDNSAQIESMVRNQSRGLPEQRTLRPTLSKIVMNSLEFSEALPFAAFASLLVEMAARLEFVIEETEELARAANFREFSDEVEIDVDDKDSKSCKPVVNQASQQAAD